MPWNLFKWNTRLDAIVIICICGLFSTHNRGVDSWWNRFLCEWLMTKSWRNYVSQSSGGQHFCFQTYKLVVTIWNNKIDFLMKNTLSTSVEKFSVNQVLDSLLDRQAGRLHFRCGQSRVDPLPAPRVSASWYRLLPSAVVWVEANFLLLANFWPALLGILLGGGDEFLSRARRLLQEFFDGRLELSPAVLAAGPLGRLFGGFVFVDQLDLFADDFLGLSHVLGGLGLCGRVSCVLCFTCENIFLKNNHLTFF